MKTVGENYPQSRDLSGPTTAVLVALAGAALVAAGLLLVGHRDFGRIGFSAPSAPYASVQTVG
jgi:hypothetical protein